MVKLQTVLGFRRLIILRVITTTLIIIGTRKSWNCQVPRFSRPLSEIFNLN